MLDSNKLSMARVDLVDAWHGLLSASTALDNLLTAAEAEDRDAWVLGCATPAQARARMKAARSHARAELS